MSPTLPHSHYRGINFKDMTIQDIIATPFDFTTEGTDAVEIKGAISGNVDQQASANIDQGDQQLQSVIRTPLHLGEHESRSSA
ncbi:hypothetical protein B0O80DRAFT_502170 [Mortierella sp. GBAus27b]|nr:hypothetical protein B0O80DRAFT_502170 [Mortierella sp. GBAus27b]